MLLHHVMKLKQLTLYFRAHNGHSLLAESSCANPTVPVILIQIFLLFILLPPLLLNIYQGHKRPPPYKKRECKL